MTINILSKGVTAYKPVYQAACMECWTTFTYEPEDIQHIPKDYIHTFVDTVKCPVCKHSIFVNDKISYVKT
jgi:DNA-directed RNA polymerase subunit RPC12/RpoP